LAAGGTLMDLMILEGFSILGGSMILGHMDARCMT